MSAHELRAARNLLADARAIIARNVWNPGIPRALHGDEKSYELLLIIDEFLGGDEMGEGVTLEDVRRSALEALKRALDAGDAEMTRAAVDAVAALEALPH